MDEQPNDIPTAVSPEAQAAQNLEAADSEESAAAQSREFRALGIGLAGWLIPGLGHALQKMWGRALAVFFSVAALITLGAAMRGNVFTSQGEDAFATLGYLADLGSGAFYLVVRAMEWAGPDVSHSAGDYGTRFIATAGVLNLLAALHAYEAARGRKA
jgi:predicted lipid-binding transport protein (Tim44 family)